MYVNKYKIIYRAKSKLSLDFKTMVFTILYTFREIKNSIKLYTAPQNHFSNFLVPSY